MADRKLDENSRQSIYKQKLRCNMCHEIPIIKEVVNGGGLNIFVSAECLNKHGVFFCTLKDFCSDKNQIEKIKCHNCNKVQGIIDNQLKFFFYCKECQKFLCPVCYSAHYKKNQKHHVTRIDDLDFICKEHGKEYSGFCPNCNMNICSLCLKAHGKHDKRVDFKNVMPLQQKIKEVFNKIENQKTQIIEINKILDNILKIANDKIKEYQQNLKYAWKFNNQIFNGMEPKKPNYQSIVNFDKIFDIDISDISWVGEIQEELDKFIKLIKKKSSTVSNEKFKRSATHVDKDFMDTLKQSVIGSTNKHTRDVLEDQKLYDFTGNELLSEIGIKNQRIIKTDEIIGELKNIYIMKECKNYLTLADNGIFMFDEETNDLLSYIDINENLEYDEVNSLAHYYDKNHQKIYLFVGTNSNKIKIYCIDEINDYSYELIQEINIEKIKEMFCNKKGNLLVLEDNNFAIYKLYDNKYEQEKEYIGEDNETINLFSTKNNFISTVKEKGQITFYDKKDFEILFSIDKINSNEESKIFEISKNLIGLSFKNVIQVIDVEKKVLSFCFDKINMDFIESIDLINDTNFLLSCNLNNKLTTYILEIDNVNKTFKEKKKIEDLDCKLIRKIEINKVILYTKYGVNIIEN